MVARVAAALAVLVAAGCAGGSDTRLSLPPGDTFAITATMTPKTGAFGDSLTAGIRILMDRKRVDPESVKVSYGFRPYRDRTTIERVDSGNLTALLYRIELECLTLFCVPPEGGFNSTGQWGARITSGVGPVQDLVFPGVLIVSRMSPVTGFEPENTGEAEEWPPKWRADVTLPAPSFAASPTALAWTLGGLGALLLGGAAFAGWSLLRRGHLFRAPAVVPLERALALLRNARTAEQRRAALEALALVLDAEIDPDTANAAGLAQPARALAWSPAAPSEAEAAELATLAEGSR